MTLSQFSIFLFTFIAFGVFVAVVRKHRNLKKDVVIYSLGNKDFLTDDDDEHRSHGLLHVSQVLRKVNDEEDDLIVIEVPFPKNVSQYRFQANESIVHLLISLQGQDFVVMLIRVLNYNSEYSNAQLIRNEKEDDNFWVLISDGEIGLIY